MARRSMGLQFAIRFRARHTDPPVSESSRCVTVVLVISAVQRLTNFVIATLALWRASLAGVNPISDRIRGRRRTCLLGSGNAIHLLHSRPQ
jgi:hypothetical protein